jgi:hypothetical protein
MDLSEHFNILLTLSPSQSHNPPKKLNTRSASKSLASCSTLLRNHTKKNGDIKNN